MTWQINLPIRDPDTPISEVAFDAHVFESPEERAIIRELVLGAVLAGDRTAGDLFDRVAGADVGERRRLLDDAREAAGLKSATDIDDDVHHANGHEDFFDLAGLEALCKQHHGEITRAEQLNRAGL